MKNYIQKYFSKKITYNCLQEAVKKA